LSPAEYLLSKAHNVKSRPLVTDNTRDVWKPGHPRFAPFIVDQRVMLKLQQPGNLSVNKLKPRSLGHYHVVKVHDNGVTYVVEKQAEYGSVLQKSVHY
jgi:ABC-type transporter MlaC component